jgi:hypothetical protein
MLVRMRAVGKKMALLKLGVRGNADTVNVNEEFINLFIL